MRIGLLAVVLSGLFPMMLHAGLPPWLDRLEDSNKSAEINKRWHADGGQVNLQFFYGMLDDLDIQVNGVDTRQAGHWSESQYIMDIKPFSGIDLKVPYGVLVGADQGSYVLDGEFSLHRSGQTVYFNGLTLRASEQAKTSSDLLGFEMVNDQGQVLFEFHHIHTILDKANELLVMKNIDVSMTAELANLLGEPRLAGTVVAQAHIESNLVIPAEGFTDINSVEGSSCAQRPKWPGPGTNDPQADVALIAMSARQYRHLNNGSIVVTPSATLKNVGGLDDADVAWYTKFSGTFPPYNNAQHPFLIWNMYREIDGRFEQIGVSGVKHAFLTINSNCTINCQDGHILWPGCEDVYGMGNNDSPRSLGPRTFSNPNFSNTEINAKAGTWQEDCSFFDQDCNGSQETNSDGSAENRMVVQESDLGVAGAKYYVSAWYIIRDDINIFNTMGYKEYLITPAGDNWLFSETGGFQNGPASDQYVAPNTIDLINNEASTRIENKSKGSLTVAVKIDDLGGGQYRYNYMVENHDYDPQIEAVRIAMHDSLPVNNLEFSDVDENTGNDWTVNHVGGEMVLEAPSDNTLNWGTLYSFSFTTAAPPVEGQLSLTPMEGIKAGSLQVNSLVPFFDDDLIFANGLE
ncbi:hypothetical protein ACFODZ_14450 [Marinicella sediminis]|uniref:Uncharacterized protein n=1 Tax=Marinicella sediminis TaxID=1792834 RepID=A0ABV7JE36_9GAMM|nr:hypothetical protein [Marinicella sediminis]